MKCIRFSLDFKLRVWNSHLQISLISKANLFQLERYSLNKVLNPFWLIFWSLCRVMLQYLYLFFTIWGFCLYKYIYLCIPIGTMCLNCGYNLLMLFSDRYGHFRAMCIIINADIFDIGQIIKVNKEDLSIERSRIIVEIFMMKMVKRFLFYWYWVHMASFYLTM